MSVYRNCLGYSVYVREGCVGLLAKVKRPRCSFTIERRRIEPRRPQTMPKPPAKAPLMRETGPLASEVSRVLRARPVRFPYEWI
jgi:hypothetical protein